MPSSSVVFCLSVPEHPPVNVTAVLNGTEVLMTWEGPPGKLNGELQGYMVEYSTPATQQVSVGNIHSQQNTTKTCDGKKIFTLFGTDCPTLFFVDSLLSILDWTLTCQSICLYPCPMCLFECVPIQVEGKDPGPPHRL